MSFGNRGILLRQCIFQLQENYDIITIYLIPNGLGVWLGRQCISYLEEGMEDAEAMFFPLGLQPTQGQREY